LRKKDKKSLAEGAITLERRHGDTASPRVSGGAHITRVPHHR
jgi:hypothetical protein